MGKKTATPADYPLLAGLYEKGDDTFRRMADEAAHVIATGGWDLLGKRMPDHSDFLLNYIIIDTCISLKAGGWQHAGAAYWPLKKENIYLTPAIRNTGGNNIGLPIFRLRFGDITKEVKQTINKTPLSVAKEIETTHRKTLAGEPTNEERAARIDLALQGYFSARADIPDGTESDITDMITDIMHYCQQKEVDFDRALSMATDNYSAERDDSDGF